MTNDGQIKANRANAVLSTGPRSQEGKAKSRHNARRHGLASSLQLEPDAEKEVERLAHAIAGEEADDELLGLAREVAEAEIVLRRVFRARMMLPAIPRRPTYFKLVASPNAKIFHAVVRRVSRRKHNVMEQALHLLKEAGWSPDAPPLVEAPSKRKHKDVEADALERYERRALSRRKSAIRAFDLWRKEAEDRKRSIPPTP
jgi:hypothetical protein